MKSIFKLALLVSVFSTQLALAEKVNYSKYLDSIKTAEMSDEDLNDREGNPACGTAPIVASMYQGGAAQALATSLCHSVNKDFVVIGYEVKDESDFFGNKKKCYYINDLGMTYTKASIFLSSVQCGKKSR